MLSENCKKCTKVAHIYETHTAFEGMKLVDDMCSKCPDDPVKELEKRAGMEFGNCSGF